LPTLVELQAISAAVRTPNRLTYYGFGSGYYRTSTLNANGHWYVRMSDGYGNGFNDSYAYGVRCVR
jgi:hypothetical protein